MYRVSVGVGVSLHVVHPTHNTNESPGFIFTVHVSAPLEALVCGK